MRYWLLGRRRRNRVRAIARDSLLEHPGSLHAAELEAETRLRRDVGMGIIGSILIGLAIKLAFELLKYWWRNRAKGDPLVSYQPDEPGYFSED